MKRSKVPWNISTAEADFLTHLASSINAKNILEFGPGASTEAFIKANCNVFSLESNPIHFNEAKTRFKDFPQVTINHYTYQPNIQLPNNWPLQYDLCLVDGPYGGIGKHFSRLHSALAAINHSNLILLHDTDRKREQRTADLIEAFNFSKEQPTKKFSLFRRMV